MILETQAVPAEREIALLLFMEESRKPHMSKNYKGCKRMLKPFTLHIIHHKHEKYKSKSEDLSKKVMKSPV